MASSSVPSACAPGDAAEAARPALSLFVRYPNRDQVLQELQTPPQGLGELREALEVFHDQSLLIADRQDNTHFTPLEHVDQLYDGACLRVAVPRRTIRVTLQGTSRQRLVAWYPGATAEHIEAAVAKACGLAPGTPLELMDGDVAVVISATLPEGTELTVVPAPGAGATASNGHGHGASAGAGAGAGGGGGGYPLTNGSKFPASRGSTSHALPQRRGGEESPARGGDDGASGGGCAAAGGGVSRRSQGGHGASYTPTVPGGASSAAVHAVTGTTRSLRSSSAQGSAARSRSGDNTPQLGGGSLGPLQARSADSSFAGRSSAAARASSPGARDGASTPMDLAAQPAGRVSAPDEHCVHILAGHAGFVLSLCTVGDVLFTGSQDCNIMIWDLNNLQYIGTLPGHRGFVKCMAASLSRKMLCSGSQDKTIKVWSLETFSSTKTLHGHTSEVNSLVMMEGADVLVSGSEDKSIRVWDLSSLTLLTSLENAHGSSVFALAQLDGGLLLSASRDRTVKVWLSSTWQARRTLSPPHYDGVSALTVGASQSRFYSASRDRSIRRWDARNFESDLQLTHAHGDWLTSLALAPSENVLFSGSKDCVVKVWDPELHCKDLLLGHRGPLTALLSIDGHLFSASHDRTIRVWRVGHYEP
eukprot:TRINITY_DN2457_c0_g2_i1.p1 TRINITY_DN2457_c0_g2~~TRINITY_DN2457_c0_g2_i1.p1  ORF type:complete len:659 (-),score=145.28 TRINITY_DN2457_c0_g2_i1:53-1990(-)